MLPSLLGRKVQISQPFPRMQCSSEFARIQSPQLVAETNAWMAQFFGYEARMPDGTVYELNRDVLVMTQATYNQMQAAIKGQP